MAGAETTRWPKKNYKVQLGGATDISHVEILPPEGILAGVVPARQTPFLALFSGNIEMNGCANDPDTIAGPNWGHELRRGMVRCRECGKPIAEAEPSADGDFELSGHDLVVSSDPTCPLCGATLEPGATDCA